MILTSAFILTISFKDIQNAECHKDSIKNIHILIYDNYFEAKINH